MRTLKEITESILSEVPLKNQRRVFNYYAGMSKKDRSDLAIQVQRKNITCTEAAHTLTQWALDSLFP